MKDVMGIIYTGENDARLRELTIIRAIAALPVAGRFRVIDFLVSSMVNAGIKNIGVIMQTHQDYGQAIEAYKEALRNNPKDNETRYNLALCQRQKKDNKGGGGQNQQNQDKQDQNKDKQKDQQDKKQDQQQNQQQQQQPRNNQMSKENAERLLDAAVQQEKNTQQRLQKAMQQSPRRSLDKNW